ncbi:hypothetical protein [Nostoc sp. LEGE 12450]|uniref:hypothetical protein n=1 Tax=Nostoc sp. LEGE 12450 TaxID=1828643 RepID=UPI001881A64D|nr:hypothetical protein [Nostoc sp. LEGE 12450]MBE8985660.1 hypothetical protein [Nostoc sp. LEGE 12450]
MTRNTKYGLTLKTISFVRAQHNTVRLRQETRFIASLRLAACHQKTVNEYLSRMNPPFISVNEYLNWMNPPFISVAEYLNWMNPPLNSVAEYLNWMNPPLNSVAEYLNSVDEY